MISKMLVSIDGTESSQHALMQISPLARSEKSQLVLLSVVPSYDGDLRIMGKRKVLSHLKNSYKEALVTAENTAKVHELNQKSILEEGEPFEEILGLANRENFDLIVVSNRSSLLGGFIPIAGNATKVVNHGNTDILVIPKQASLDLKHILLAYDDSNGAQKALKRAIDLSVAYGSKLTILTAYEVPQEEMYANSRDIWDRNYGEGMQLLKNAEKVAEKSGVRNLKTEIRRGSASWEICELARNIKAGLIIMGSNQKNILTKALKENVMKQVIRNESIPVWIAKR